MEILIFYRSLNQGGVQRMMVNFANHLANAGNSVTLLLIRKEGEFLDLVDSKINVVALNNDSYLSILPTLINILNKNSFDILFTATPSLNIMSILGVRLSSSKTKVIISERSSTIKELMGTKFGLYKLSFLLVPIFYRFAHAIVAVSKGVADDLAKFALLDRDRIIVIYNPAYDESAKDIYKDPSLDSWFMTENIPVVISAGRLSEQKNFKLLVDAVSILSKKREIRLIILGEGPLKAELQNQINQLGLTAHIKLLGFKINPISWIYQSDLFVLSSLWEGFGNILVDALSAGKTIVSTNCKSGPAEILENGKFGYLLDSFEANDMAQLIDYALDNLIDSEVLIQRAENFSKSNIMKSYTSLIETLLMPNKS